MYERVQSARVDRRRDIVVIRTSRRLIDYITRFLHVRILLKS